MRWYEVDPNGFARLVDDIDPSNQILNRVIAIETALLGDADVYQCLIDIKREAGLYSFSKDDEGVSGLYHRLTMAGLELNEKLEFLELYSKVKRRFPEQKSVHRGFMSTAEDMANPAYNIYRPEKDEKGKKIKNRVGRRGYSAKQHLKTLRRILDAEPLPEKRGFRFRDDYDQRSSALKEFHLEDASKIDDLVEWLEKELKNLAKGDIKALRRHDELLPIYLRLTRYDVETVYVGDTLSTFLNLDPELQTGRCTAGSGIFRKVSYQYALHPDIRIIDLAINRRENKVAEVVTVETKDSNGNDFLLVETAEAGHDAYLLPGYNGVLGWACLLLEEVVDRAYESRRGVVFSKNVDGKQAPNIFISTASKMLGIGSPPASRKYKPLYRGPSNPLEWDELLTSVHWADVRSRDELNMGIQPFYLEKVCQPVYRNSRLQILPGVWLPLPYMEEAPDQFTENGVRRGTYLGAWGSRNPVKGLLYKALERFDLIRHPNINQGKGWVKGLVYRPTEDSYKRFKEVMGETREHIGLQPII